MKTPTRKTFAILLILCTVFLCSCAKLPAGVSSFVLGSNVQSPVPAVQAHTTLPDGADVITAADGLELLLDKASGAVSVRDMSADVVWTSLPEKTNTSAAVVSIALVSAEGRTYLNSQDNSVAFGTYKTEKIQDGIRIIYDIGYTKDAAKTLSSELASDALAVRVPVEFTISDGAFRVCVDCEKLVLPQNTVLEKLSLLPYFGALGGNIPDEDADASAGNAFLLVPDGCGAVIYTDTPDDVNTNMTYPVYGSVNGVSVSANCFGLSRGDAAFAAVIDAGDTVCSVRAIRASANADGMDTVYPEFSVTPASIAGSKYYYAAPFSGTLGVTYRFLHGTNGSCIPLAAACRETLIRSGFLTSSVEPKGSYPLNVGFIMSVDGSASGTVTKFAQVEELTGLLKAKGVSELNLILDGCFTNGVYHTGDGSFRVPASLGGKRALTDLCDYARAQNADVYAGVQILTAKRALYTAQDLQGRKTETFIINPLNLNGRTTGKSFGLSDAVSVEDNVSRTLDKTKRYGFAGYAVKDAASAVYADYKTSTSAQHMAEIVQNGIDALSSKQKLLLSGSPMCFIKEASIVTDVPITVGYPETDAYRAVPLLQAILHGTVQYSGAPANTSAQSYVLELLKTVEYGAVPYVTWVFDASSPLCYERNYSEIAEFFIRAAAELSDLADRRITGHDILDAGLYTTTYDGGSIVVVNYNNYSVNVGNITVPPYDFIRIN